MDGPGTRVTEKIVLERKLGEGAMGSVWQAHHLGLNAHVAVKFLRQAKRHAKALHRFRAEASVAAQIRSPYVVQMFDYGVTEDERPYIVMEMLDGEPLDKLLERKGTLSLAEVGKVVEHICKALAKAHAIGVVHRDLKPANLYNVGGEDLFIKVLDFGVAKQTALGGAPGVTAAGDLTGTPMYMSPEQLTSSRDVDGRTDFWALGVVAYQLLTGKFPFAATTLADLYISVHGGRFTPLAERRPDLPAALDAWFSRTFAVAREARFQSAEEVAAAFPTQPLAALSVAAVTAPPLSAPPVLSAPIVSAPLVSSPPAYSPHQPAPGPTPTSLSESPFVAPPVPATPARRGIGAALWGAIATIALGAAAATVFVMARDEPAPVAPAAADASEPENAADPPRPSSPPSPTPSPPATPGAPPSVVKLPPTPVGTTRPPSPVVPPSSPPPTAPKPNCEGDNAYYVNAKGRLVPKPECVN
jgi:eukaryotic-like serine/threonine-protein kinase